MINVSFKGEDGSTELAVLEKIERVTFKKGFQSENLTVPESAKAQAIVQMDSGHVFNILHTEEEYTKICEEATLATIRKDINMAKESMGMTL